MRELPILFKGPMVRAVLDGTKTQTRRIVKRPYINGAQIFVEDGRLYSDNAPTEDITGCGPFGDIGTRLYVRETFSHLTAGKGLGAIVQYEADYKAREIQDVPMKYKTYDWIKVPSIHMPKKFARIWLEVTSVRVERLQDITPADAIAEGIAPVSLHSLDCESPNPVDGFKKLWESIEGKGSWAKNPWLWVVEFKRVEQEAASK